jgi:hypothetical protein
MPAKQESGLQDNGVSPSLKSALRRFLLNSAIILLSAVIYRLASAASWEFMPVNIVGLIIGVIEGLFWSTVMLGPFLISYAIISKRNLAPFRFNAWLCGPSILLALFFLGLAIWTSRPAQRLSKIADARIDGATNIHAAGITSFLSGDWIVTCHVVEATFFNYCHDQRLAAEETINVIGRLKNRSLIRSAKIITELPDFESPLTMSWLEGDNQRHGLFTNTSHYEVLSSGWSGSGGV